MVFKKRRSTRRISYSRPKRSTYRRSNKKINELAIIGYSAILEPMIDNKVSGKLGVSTDVIKVLGGFMLKKKSGIVGDIGTAMYISSLYQLGKTGFSTLGIGQNTSTANNGIEYGVV